MRALARVARRTRNVHAHHALSAPERAGAHRVGRAEYCDKRTTERGFVEAPQIFNGRRFDCDFSGLPRSMAAFEACMDLDAFQRAQPSQSPDAEA